MSKNTVKHAILPVAATALFSSAASAAPVSVVAAVTAVPGGEAGVLAMLSLSVVGAIWLARRKS